MTTDPIPAEKIRQQSMAVGQNAKAAKQLNGKTQKLSMQMERVKMEMEKQGAIAKIKTTLTRDDLLRFGYVPFVICRLVWDYADTILDICIQNRIEETKKLCRAIREAKREYDRHRPPFMSTLHEDFEEEKMLVFEDHIAKNTKLFLANLKCEIEKAHSDIDVNRKTLIIAIYQCRALLLALLRYTDRQSEKIGDKLGWKLKNVLPSETRQLQTTLEEFAKIFKLQKTWSLVELQFINTFATQAALIPLTEDL